MTKPGSPVWKTIGFWLIRAILTVGSGISLLFLWQAVANAEAMGRGLSCLYGSIGAAFFVPLWGALRGKVSRAIVLPIVVVALAGLIQFDMWALRMDEWPPDPIPFSDIWWLLLPSIPGMVW